MPRHNFRNDHALGRRTDERWGQFAALRDLTDTADADTTPAAPRRDIPSPFASADDPRHYPYLVGYTADRRSRP